MTRYLAALCLLLPLTTQAMEAKLVMEEFMVPAVDPGIQLYVRNKHPEAVSKFAPGKIRVTDDCNQCGHCTVTCMANVQVAAEVNKYGMVIDPGCMKHMDCISVCPNDALYFGFGKPSVTVSKPRTEKKAYALTWPEEIFAAVVPTMYAR